MKNFRVLLTNICRLRILVLQFIFYILCEINVNTGKSSQTQTLLHLHFSQGLQDTLQCISSPQSWFSLFMTHSKVCN